MVLGASSPSGLSRASETERNPLFLNSQQYESFPPNEFSEAMARARHLESRDLSRDPNSGRKAQLAKSGISTIGFDSPTESSRGRSRNRGGYHGAQMRNYMSRSYLSPSQLSTTSNSVVSRSLQKPEWVGVIDTMQRPRGAKENKKQRSRARSASPGGPRLGRQHVRPSPGQLQLRKRRSRSPASDGSPARRSLEITKGTYWGLYSEEEAQRRKTDAYYMEIEKIAEMERSEIAEIEQSLSYVPPHRNVETPGSLQRKKRGSREDLYRQLRGEH